jgi:hypothetical protein
VTAVQGLTERMLAGESLVLQFDVAPVVKAVFDLYNLEESRRNINRLAGTCNNSSPAVANYARMALSLVTEAERSFSSISSRLRRP